MTPYLQACLARWKDAPPPEDAWLRLCLSPSFGFHGGRLVSTILLQREEIARLHALIAAGHTHEWEPAVDSCGNDRARCRCGTDDWREYGAPDADSPVTKGD